MFRTGKNFSENYPKLGTRTLKIFASPALGRNSLNNIGLKRRQIVRLPKVTTCLGPAMAFIWFLFLSVNVGRSWFCQYGIISVVMQISSVPILGQTCSRFVRHICSEVDWQNFQSNFFSDAEMLWRGKFYPLFPPPLALIG